MPFKSDRPLQAAVIKHDLALIEKILDELTKNSGTEEEFKKEINAIDEHGCSALMYALRLLNPKHQLENVKDAAAKNLQILQKLLDIAQIEINIYDSVWYGITEYFGEHVKKEYQKYSSLMYIVDAYLNGEMEKKVFAKIITDPLLNLDMKSLNNLSVLHQIWIYYLMPTEKTPALVNIYSLSSSFITTLLERQKMKKEKDLISLRFLILEGKFDLVVEKLFPVFEFEEIKNEAAELCNIVLKDDGNHKLVETWKLVVNILRLSKNLEILNYRNLKENHKNTALNIVNDIKRLKAFMGKEVPMIFEEEKIKEICNAITSKFEDAEYSLEETTLYELLLIKAVKSKSLEMLDYLLNEIPKKIRLDLKKEYAYFEKILEIMVVKEFPELPPRLTFEVGEATQLITLEDKLPSDIYAFIAPLFLALYEYIKAWARSEKDSSNSDLKGAVYKTRDIFKELCVFVSFLKIRDKSTKDVISFFIKVLNNYIEKMRAEEQAITLEEQQRINKNVSWIQEEIIRALDGSIKKENIIITNTSDLLINFGIWRKQAHEGIGGKLQECCTILEKKVEFDANKFSSQKK